MVKYYLITEGKIGEGFNIPNNITIQNFNDYDELISILNVDKPFTVELVKESYWSLWKLDRSPPTLEEEKIRGRHTIYITLKKEGGIEQRIYIGYNDALDAQNFQALGYSFDPGGMYNKDEIVSDDEKKRIRGTLQQNLWWW